MGWSIFDRHRVISIEPSATPDRSGGGEPHLIEVGQGVAIPDFEVANDCDMHVIDRRAFTFSGVLRPDVCSECVDGSRAGFRPRLFDRFGSCARLGGHDTLGCLLQRREHPYRHPSGFAHSAVVVAARCNQQVRQRKIVAAGAEGCGSTSTQQGIGISKAVDEVLVLGTEGIDGHDARPFRQEPWFSRSAYALAAFVERPAS